MVVFAVVALCSYLALRGSLPQLDGELGVDQIRAVVLIERDAAGIPVITARDRIDLAFATGCVHGQDRFFQMDLSRRRATLPNSLDRPLCRSINEIDYTGFAIVPVRKLLI